MMQQWRVSCGGRPVSFSATVSRSSRKASASGNFVIQEKSVDWNDRRRPTTPSRPPTNLLKTHMGKQSRRKTTTHTPSLAFEPVPLPPEHMDTKEAKLRQQALDVGAVSKWEVGRRGGLIASRFVACTGDEDTLTSTNADDRNYSALLGAHLVRLHAIVKDIDTPPRSIN